MNSRYTVAVLGLWHLGETYSAGLAELGHRVIGIAPDEEAARKFAGGEPPLPEPGLSELLHKHQASGVLSYTADISRASECNVVWLTFDTPVDDHDEVSLDIVFEALRKAAPHLRDGVTLAASSQLPVGTSARMVDLLRSLRPELRFGYFYSPENLRLGDAVRCFLSPGRVVLGADTPEAALVAQELFAPLGAEVVVMSVASAEMTKHAMNAWLATSISFTNDLADMCEVVGADIEDVIRALKAEPRVGTKAYLFAGLGFSGGTLGRDLRALAARAREAKISLPIIEGAYAKNQARNGIVRRRLEQAWGGLSGKTVAIFGVTYKPGTPTLRRSQPLEIEADLRAHGATIRLTDPLALPLEVAERTLAFFSRDPYEAAKGADAILILSPDSKLRDLDFKRLRSVVRTPIIFDAQNMLTAQSADIRAAGFTYWSVGRP